MNKKVLIAVLVILILVIILGLVSVYLAVYSQKFFPAGVKISEKKIVVVPPPSISQATAQIQKDYPEVITGTINFLDAKGTFETTLKTDSGTTYTLWPPQPEAIYESLGIKNGAKVQVNGKSLGGDKLGWALMKPL